MPKFIDLTNQRFGCLVVQKYLGKSRWLCACDCGATSTVRGQALREGLTKSCGCGIALSNQHRAAHGMYQTAIYSVWQGMKDRCNNPNNSGYHRYGGRGVKVCGRWQEFEDFFTDMGHVPEGMTLDRIDVDGDYSPDNCRWATRQDQQNNMSTNRLFTYEGRTQTLAEWARELGLAYHALKYRLNKGWQPPELFTTENLKGKTVKHLVEYEGEMIPIKEAAERSGVPMQTLYWRLRNGRELF